jgi:hypothetical protein
MLSQRVKTNTVDRIDFDQNELKRCILRYDFNICTNWQRGIQRHFQHENIFHLEISVHHKNFQLNL